MARGKIIRYTAIKNGHTRIISVAVATNANEAIILSSISKILTADPLFRTGYIVFNKKVVDDVEIPDEWLPFEIISNRLLP